MKLAVVGSGYVGLVAGTCFAETGNEVSCIDIDQRKIARLREGIVPIYEPGLSELIDRNVEAGRLHFTTDLAEGISGAACVFIAVGTPQAEDGAADLSNLWQLVESLAACIKPEQIVVIKSTVPVGTNAETAKRLSASAGFRVDVASNPEFMKEGAAIGDFTKPDRVVVGVRTQEAADVLQQIYAPFLRTEQPFLEMTPESAEMTKYVANSLLAAKISFINEMANLCQCAGADINEVRRGIGHDQRIGFAFLFPGVGYGGSCFPKDVRALSSCARALGVQPLLLDAIDAVNNAQKQVLFAKMNEHFGGAWEGRTVAVWGLAFKPRTDDIREAPAIVLIDQLLRHGATVRVHDPEALDNVRAEYGERLTYCDKPYGTLEDADALAIVTEWNQFRNPDFEVMRRIMKHPVIFDGRNLYEPDALAEQGFTYHSIGRPLAVGP